MNLTIYMEPHDSALGQPLRMAAHALDWGDSLNRHRRGGKRSTMVMMFVGGSCVVVQRIIHTIPTVGNLRVGSFLLLLGDYW